MSNRKMVGSRILLRVFLVALFAALGLFGCGGASDSGDPPDPGAASAGGPTPPSSDTQAPTVPAGLAVTGVSDTVVNLSWSASSDNVGVTAYRVFRGGVQIATPTVTSYSDTGLSPSTIYAYTVAAVDAANNASAQSSSVNATTVVSAGTITPSLVASRLSGVAPLAVFFDATGTTAITRT